MGRISLGAKVAYCVSYMSQAQAKKDPKYRKVSFLHVGALDRHHLGKLKIDSKSPCLEFFFKTFVPSSSQRLCCFGLHQLGEGSLAPSMKVFAMLLCSNSLCACGI